MEKKNGILVTADLHLRDDIPTCRTDDFIHEQWRKMDFIAELVKTKNLYWVDCGDLFHSTKPSYALISRLMSWFRSRDVRIEMAILGNHDMPGHNMKSLDNSAWSVIFQAGFIKTWMHNCIQYELQLATGPVYLTGLNYTESIDVLNNWSPDSLYGYNTEAPAALLYHDMVFKNERGRIADVPGMVAEELYDKSPFHTIFTGHNHTHFIWQPDDKDTIQIDYKNAHGVFNAGSLTRQTADQMAHTPCVFMWDGKCRPVPQCLPYTPAERCMTRKHLDTANEREEKLEAFIETVQNNVESTLNFLQTVQKVLYATKASKAVRQKVAEAME